MSDEKIPVYQESIGSSLIDAARIAVIAAMATLPRPEVPLIILPGSAEQEADDAAATVHGCLEEAMEWLDAARRHTVAAGAPVTSFHRVAGTAEIHCVFCGCTERNACALRVADQPEDFRRAIAALAKRQGVDVPEVVGCTWFETDPPVCCAPACVEKHMEQLATNPSP